MHTLIHNARQTGLWLCALALFIGYCILCAIGVIAVAASVLIRVAVFCAVWVVRLVAMHRVLPAS